MKAIVHIGTEKTGTTSIQNFLYKNRRKLQKAGYHFVLSAGITNNRAIPAICLGEDRFDDYFLSKGIDTMAKRDAYREKFTKEFAAEINGLPRHVHTVLISSEHFHSRLRAEEEVDNVHHFLTQFFDDIRIVCYLREQVTTSSSFYSTSLKAGDAVSYGEFMRRCTSMNYYFNHEIMLANWERRFGFDALDVSLFNRSQFVNGDLLHDFTSKIDPALIGSLNMSIDAENESFTPEGQALLRAINMVFPVRTVRKEVVPIRKKCLKLIDSKLKGKGQQLSLEKRLEIYDDFRESNEQVRQKFFPDLDVTFAPPTESGSVEIEMTDAFVEVQIAILEVLKTDGRGIVTPQELAEFTMAVGQSWSELGASDDDGEEAGKQLVLTRNDAEILRYAALGYEKRNLKIAYRLMSLAESIDATLPGLRSKMDKFTREHKLPTKPRFFIRSYVNTNSPDWDEEKLDPDEFEKWYKGFSNNVIGSMINRLDNKWRVGVPNVAQAKQFIQHDSFTIIEAESMEEAQQIASRSPLLKLGGVLEVSSLSELVSEAHR